MNHLSFHFLHLCGNTYIDCVPGGLRVQRSPGYFPLRQPASDWNFNRACITVVATFSSCYVHVYKR